MGTRALTVFLDETDSSEIVVMYRQMDGYPEGHGQELVDFLQGFSVVNGFPLLADNTKVANGMSCLAAQVVSHFKKGCGGIYLHPAGTRNCGEDYIYTVYQNGETHKNGKNLCIRVNYGRRGQPELFDGLIQSYDCDVIQENLDQIFDFHE